MNAFVAAVCERWLSTRVNTEQVITGRKPACGKLNFTEVADLT